MNNPVPYTGLFATPQDHTALMEYISQYSGTERTAAIVAAHMALNLAHKLVAEAAVAEAK